MSVEWHGEEVVKKIEPLMFDAVKRCVVAFWNELQAVLNVSNPRPYQSPSRRGEPPRKRTGNLAANVTYKLQPKALKATVGLQPNAIYGGYLESGTSRMGPRPWFAATLERMKARFATIIGEK